MLLIHLANQLSSHPTCNAAFFAIDPGPWTPTQWIGCMQDC
jgi:hypothetical protein